MKPGVFWPALLAVACFAGGWLVEGWRMGGELARLQAAQAAAAAQGVAAAQEQLQAAQAINDTLAARVAATENQLLQSNREKADAIRQISTGRRCLDVAAVRVLNGTDDSAALGLPDRKSTRLNSSHRLTSRMPSSA
jgi:hypothetical protein